MDRGVAGGGRSSSDRSAGLGPSQLTVPDWVDAVNELFPQQSKEVMQKELVRRRGIAEIMEKPELLEKIEPNLELVKTLLTHRELAESADAHPRTQDHRQGGRGVEAQDASAGGTGNHRRYSQGSAFTAQGLPQPRSEDHAAA